MAADKDVIIALDEGTTNAKAIALDDEGNVIARFTAPLTLQTPREGWVEQSGDLLLSASVAVLEQAIRAVGVQRIAGLAISNQRETAIGWYRQSGKTLGPAISWQCSRTAPFCETLRQQGERDAVQALTGLPIAPLFSGSKMRWLLDSVPEGRTLAQRGEICLGTIDSWLLWNLTAGEAFCCDESNASRTQLFNIHEGRWDERLLQLFGVPLAALPQVCPTSHRFGHTKGVAGIPDGIPILAMAGDSHAALFGHALGKPGCVKATYGTGSSVMAPVSVAQAEMTTLATTVAWHDGDKRVYGLEGNIPHTGDAVAWLTDCTGLDELAPEALAAALNTLPASVDSTLGVYFVPALTGLGAPWWDDRARGSISGLSRGVKRAHLVRAALEAIAYQIADVVLAMRQHADFELSALMVDGGPTRNDWLMQYQADLLGCTVMRSDVAELSAVGAAIFARKALHPERCVDLMRFTARHTAFTPDMARHGRLQKRWQEWQAAVAKVRDEQHG